MRRYRLLVAATAAAATATAVVVFVSGSATADNTVLNFTGSYGPGAACAAPYDFPVGASTTTIDVAATAVMRATSISRFVSSRAISTARSVSAFTASASARSAT